MIAFFNSRSTLHSGTSFDGADLPVLSADCTRPGYVVLDGGQVDLVYIDPETGEVLGEEGFDDPRPPGSVIAWRISSGLEDRL